MRLNDNDNSITMSFIKVGLLERAWVDQAVTVWEIFHFNTPLSILKTGFITAEWTTKDIVTHVGAWRYNELRMVSFIRIEHNGLVDRKVIRRYKQRLLHSSTLKLICQQAIDNQEKRLFSFTNDFSDFFLHLISLSLKRGCIVLAETLTPVWAFNLLASCCTGFETFNNKTVTSNNSFTFPFRTRNTNTISTRFLTWQEVCFFFCSRIDHFEFFRNCISANSSFKHAKNLVIPSHFHLGPLGADFCKILSTHATFT